MKFQTKTNRIKGFTITELLVVISIMGVISTLVIAGFNQTRGRRDVKIAQNELVTNIRKVQGYMLSSRDLPNGEKAKFYVIRFERNTNSYSIGAISDNNFYANIENISLSNFVSFNRMRVHQGSTITTVDCAYIIFSAPYGKMYIDHTQPCDESIEDIVNDPAELILRADRQLEMVLTESQNQTERGIKIQSLSDTIREEAPFEVKGNGQGGR